MDKSKTRILHTRALGAPVECPRPDLSGEGLEITVDKRTHQLLLPKDRETEGTVTIVILPLGDGCTPGA